MFASGSFTRAGRTEQLCMYAMSSSVFAVVDQIVQSQTGVTWRLYNKDADDAEADRTPNTTHPALDLWQRPNDFYTLPELVEATAALGAGRRAVAGRRPCAGANENGLPLELWPIRPDRMRPVVDPERFIVGYMYRGGGEEIPLGLRDVIYVRKPNPLDPFRGLSPIAALILDVEGEQAAAQYNTLFFANGAAARRAHPGHRGHVRARVQAHAAALPRIPPGRQTTPTASACRSWARGSTRRP